MGLPKQTGLQSRLHHVEWARNDGSGHATNPEEKSATWDVSIQAFSAKDSRTHAPPTKCCQDFAGTHFDCVVSDIGNSPDKGHDVGREDSFGHVTRTD